MKPIPYGKQYINQADIDAVVTALNSDFLTQGPAIAEFEKKFSTYIGCNYAVAVSNGTAALHLAALALGVDNNTNVITTPITFSASANCIRYCGGQVHFADIDKETYLIDLQKLEALIESKPKGFFQGIIPVDFAGRPVNLEAIKSIADKHALWVIEDACHAPGGFFIDSKGTKQNCGNGRYAETAVFSFHPVKHIACGEGGMVTTNDEQLYQRLLKLRTHGITRDPSLMKENHGGWYYEMQELGYNYRLTDFQAALGLSQLSRADEGLVSRIRIAKQYNEAFSRMPGIIQHSGFSEGHAYHLYVIEVADREGLYDYLKSAGIFAQVHYIPVHLMPYYREIGYKHGDYPIAEKYYTNCLSIPMYPTLTDDEQGYVIEQINNFLQR